MILKKIFDEAQNYEDLKYDDRLALAIGGEEGFEKYKNNPGHTYYLFLKKLIRLTQPKNVVELGTSIGRSALFMMTDLPKDSTLTTIELGSFQRTDLRPFENDPRLRIVYGDDTEQSVVNQVPKDIDFLYIDSLHEEEHLRKEWEIYRKLLVPNQNTLVVLDDIRLDAGMASFWESLTYEKYESKDLHFSGFGVFVYR